MLSTFWQILFDVPTSKILFCMQTTRRCRGGLYHQRFGLLENGGIIAAIIREIGMEFQETGNSIVGGMFNSVAYPTHSHSLAPQLSDYSLRELR
uniref:Uncharacterized protein n=1 Tax=Rhizophora mucronata TaxID=61149 RepID=A0A2P2K6A5_RHIMU